MGQSIVGCGQRRGAGDAEAVLRFVDQRLRMLGADTDRKRLRLDGQTRREQPLERIARRVTGGEEHATGVDDPRGRGDRLHATVAKREVVHAGLELDVDAVAEKRCADRPQDAEQQVRADVRLGVDQDALRRPGFDQALEDFAHERILLPRRELAVAIGAGAAFAKTEVRLGIELAFGAEPAAVPRAGLDGFAALEQSHACAVLGQVPGGEQSCRAGTDDDDRGAVRRCPR